MAQSLIYLVLLHKTFRCVIPGTGKVEMSATGQLRELTPVLQKLLFLASSILSSINFVLILYPVVKLHVPKYI